ncbi:hypothetical protein [Mycobacterium paragordonae]|uniref:Uncharacterized protein n=1 Tax=Mycobacterium paragordonae TaxID=1389713 RepID=A0AAJ1S011_9MYCO|nr:hypothetical protein [Mycobacterium paragordonae]MDP7733694.1 hypothetical protein [Mycobacterium paragordonae]
MGDWAENMRSMLGECVNVTIDYEKPVVVTGLLHSFTEDGEVVVRDECGILHWCWPNLKTELV